MDQDNFFKKENIKLIDYRNVEIKIVKDWMWINGIRFRRYPFHNKEEVFQLIECWENGIVVKQLEKIFHIQKSKIKFIRKAFGFTIKHGGYKKRGESLRKYIERKNNIISDWKNGLSIRDIMERNKCTEQVVHYNKNKKYQLESVI